MRASLGETDRDDTQRVIPTAAIESSVIRATLTAPSDERREFDARLEHSLPPAKTREFRS
jgi:hypothetical protein